MLRTQGVQMLTDKIYQIIIGTLGAILLVLSIGYWLTSSELKDLKLEHRVTLAESEVLKISNSSLVAGINKQSTAIRELEAKQKAKDLEVAKVITKINTRYITRYEMVRDLNETTECEALKRIIDEEVNSTIGTPTI